MRFGELIGGRLSLNQFIVESVCPDSAIAFVESLERFRIVSALGKGGMGNVFEAVEPNGSLLACMV